MKTTIALLLLAGSAAAQTTYIPPLPVTATTVPLVYVTQPRQVSFNEEVDKGAYEARFHDPYNEWRCYVTSVIDGRPTPTTVTITCVKNHKVEGEAGK